MKYEDIEWWCKFKLILVGNSCRIFKCVSLCSTYLALFQRTGICSLILWPVNPAYFDLTSTSIVRPLRKTNHFCFSFFLIDVDPLIVLLVLFIGLILCLLSLTVFLSQHKSVFMSTHHLNKDKCLYTDYYEGHYCPWIIVKAD